MSCALDTLGCNYIEFTPLSVSITTEDSHAFSTGSSKLTFIAVVGLGAHASRILEEVLYKFNE